MNGNNKKNKTQKEEMKVCEDCRFKYKKSEMLEKVIKKKEGEESKGYCRRCAPHNIG